VISGQPSSVLTAEGKQARASIEVRKFEQTGRVFFDLSGLEVLK